MDEESKKLKKRLEKRLKVVRTRIAVLRDEEHDLLNGIFDVKGKPYVCKDCGEFCPGFSLVGRTKDSKRVLSELDAWYRARHHWKVLPSKETVQ